jgi:hypothetical protein
MRNCAAEPPAGTDGGPAGNRGASPLRLIVSPIVIEE